MKKNIYIFSDSLLKRKDNTLFCESITHEDEDHAEELQLMKEEFFLDKQILIPSGNKKFIPIEAVNSIYAFGSVNFNSRFLFFISQHQIPMHVFSFNGAYSGSFIPSERPFSGSVIIDQVKVFNDYEKRLFLAKQFITAAAANSLANLKYYQNRGSSLSDYIEHISDLSDSINSVNSVPELMGIEGMIKKAYYSAWQRVFIYPVNFTHRVKNPPNNLINSLISYGNMIVYTICLNEIYQTRLYPEIGYLHEPGDCRLSLCYDIAEIFKPILTDRIIFKVINKNIISEKDGFTKNGFCRIKMSARKAFSEEFEIKLNTKIQLPNKPTRFTYKRIIREECYNLLKHIKGEEEYIPYISKW